MAVNGPFAIVAAFAGGLLAFLSPCTLPLLPGYLSYISGMGVDDVQDKRNASAVVRAAGLFVLGFSLIFVALGATASVFGSLIVTHREALTRASGVFIIVMGLFMLGIVQIPALYREKRFHVSRQWGIWSAFPLGMAFAFGWTPCVGTTLAPILLLAMDGGTMQRGAGLLLVYALGLGIPFLLVALFAGRMLNSLSWFRRHYRALNMMGGGVLLVMGAFLVLNEWTQLLAPAMRWYAQLNLPT